MRRHTANAWVFLAVPLTVLFVFTLAPTVAGLVLSVFSWSGAGWPRFVGLQNFRGMAGDARFWPAAINTLVFVVLTVPSGTAIAFALAAALDAPWFVGKTFARTALFLPTVVSIVAVGFVWRWVLDDAGGLAPAAIRGLGLSPPQFLQGGSIIALGDVNIVAWPMVSIAVVQVWRTVGMGVILYLAAMHQISPSLYDAAEVDGASRWRTLTNVTWPGVRPMTVFLLVTGVIGALQVFDVVWAITGSADSRATDVLNWYVYRQFQQNRLGYAAAVGAVIFVATAVVTGLQLALLGSRDAGERPRR